MIQRAKRLPQAGLICAAVAALGGLGGCVPLAVVGGAASAGVLLYTAERRSNETQSADQAFEASLAESLPRAMPGRGHVNANSYYRKVLLTGEVPTEADRRLAEAQARALPGVAGVVNELAVMPESSSLTRSNDGLITSRVRARLVNQNGVPAGSVRVVTERGTTYLMGRLTPSEATLATEVTRQTEGVVRVVRVIDLIADPMGGVGALPGPVPPPPPPAGAAPMAGEAAPGVVVSPVTQPAITPARPAVEVQQLPALR